MSQRHSAPIEPNTQMKFVRGKRGLHRTHAHVMDRSKSSAYSGLMPAARTTWPHFSVSSEMRLPNSAGEPGSGSPPMAAKPCLHAGVGDGRIDFLVELVDDFGRRVPGRADAIPLACFITRHEIADGRQLRQHFRARGGGNRERAQLAGADVFGGPGRGGEEDLHLPTKQIRQRRTLAAVGDMDQVTPAIILNNSPAIWGALPLPADAMLTLPGLALA